MTGVTSNKALSKVKPRSDLFHLQRRLEKMQHVLQKLQDIHLESSDKVCEKMGSVYVSEVVTYSMISCQRLN